MEVGGGAFSGAGLPFSGGVPYPGFGGFPYVPVTPLGALGGVKGDLVVPIVAVGVAIFILIIIVMAVKAALALKLKILAGGMDMLGKKFKRDTLSTGGPPGEDQINHLAILVLSAIQSQSCAQNIICHIGAYTRSQQGLPSLIRIIENIAPTSVHGPIETLRVSAEGSFDCDEKFKCNIHDPKASDDSATTSTTQFPSNQQQSNNQELEFEYPSWLGIVGEPLHMNLGLMMGLDMYDNLKRIVHPYFLVNIFLSLSYIVCKFVKPLCDVVFAGDCEMDMRQGEILFFLLVVVMVRARKHGSMNFLSYLNNSFMYCKVANTVLWFSAWKPYGFIFAFFFLLQAFILPEPLYSGPEQVIYFRDEKLFKDEIEKKGNGAWLVEFYTTWNPACVNLAPIFAELSAKYALPNFQFGKVDVGRLPDLGHQYGISDSPFSKQLPTLILFKNGSPSMMRPTADAQGKLIKFHMNMESIATAFDLNNLYNELKLKANKKPKEVEPKHAKSD